MCQRTVGGVVVFYSMADYLVFFTVFCSVAERMEMPVLALCPMPDHLHQVCRPRSHEQLSQFVQLYTQLFAKEWNLSRGRKGSLFRARFNSSVKLGNKEVRSTINYNNNNPVERKLVTKAEDYRWNFLLYARQPSPYSAPIHQASASRQLRRALQEVRVCHDSGQWMHYKQWDRWIKGLERKEVLQLADYIICTWNILDYYQSISYYGDFEAMIRSFHDNTGSEYEIVEDRDKYSDAVYADAIRLLLKEKWIQNVREIPLLPPEKKARLYMLLSHRTPATPRQIRKLLHWQVKS